MRLDHERVQHEGGQRPGVADRVEAIRVRALDGLPAAARCTRQPARDEGRGRRQRERRQADHEDEDREDLGRLSAMLTPVRRAAGDF